MANRSNSHALGFSAQWISNITLTH